jgi:hypothetical protein
VSRLTQHGDDHWDTDLREDIRLSQVLTQDHGINLQELDRQDLPYTSLAASDVWSYQLKSMADHAALDEALTP